MTIKLSNQNTNMTFISYINKYIWEPTIEQIESHRVTMREQLQKNDLNFFILLSVLPFILGFNQFLMQYLLGEQKKFFFIKNLPGINFSTEKFDWQTFTMLNSLPNSQTVLFWDPGIFLIKNKSTNHRLLTSTQNYKSYIFTDIDSNYPLFYNPIVLSNRKLLDSIPFKLKSFYSNSTQKINLNFDLKPEPIHYFSSIPTDSRKNTIHITKNVDQKHISGLKNNTISYLSSPKSSISEYKKYKTDKQILITELQNLFFRKDLIPNINLNSMQHFFSVKSSKVMDLSEIQKIYTSNLFSNFITTRTMSGYIYPDIDLLRSINTSSLITNSIQIPIPFSFLVSNDTYSTKNLDKQISIQIENMVFDQNSPFEINYTGPATLFDIKNGLDWKFSDLNQQEKFRNWLISNIQFKNETSTNLQTFFPSKSSTLYTQNYTNFDIEYWLNNLGIIQTGNFINTKPSFFEYTSILQFPFFSIDTLSKQLLNFDSTNPTLSLPILQSRIYTKIKLSEKHINFAFTPKIHNKTLFFKFIQQHSQYLNNEYSLNYFNAGLYKSRPSIFSLQKKSVFFTSLWEPLTIHSWLVTTQVGFAFLIFRTLKALADNYGRELLVYLLDLVALLGFVDEELKQEIEILMGQKEKGFRIITRTDRTFSQIGGMKHLLPEIIEIIWFLRNSGRTFSLSKIIPHGILLTGPPGTGKTLLVQAIAGEAKVPVIALSGSSLLEPGESGALKLQLLFQEARQLAPCIVFIDEIDTLAEKRELVLQNPMGADEVIESLSPNVDLEYKTENIKSNIGQQEMHKEKLRILMQFLVELDGIQGRNGIIIIGATNRPEILDPAVLRPGRFDKIVKLGLPGPEKRKEILELYSKNLGIDTTISWDYFVDRTIGYSSADLASIMNQSTLSAILHNTNHTVETIEFGIDRTTTIGFEQSTTHKNCTIFTLQIAYYQVGKLLISFILNNHPNVLVTHLWPRKSNIRALQIQKNLQQHFFKFAQRIDLEERIIACYAGKAAEILFLQNNSKDLNLSDLGIEDLDFAQKLIDLVVNKWYLTDSNLVIQKNSQNLVNFNEKEYYSEFDKSAFFNDLASKVETNLHEESQQFVNISDISETEIRQQAQTFFETSIWQAQIASEFEYATRIFSDWYRLYLPDPQQIDRNLEWVPPDEFYHTNELLNPFSSGINWNSPMQISKSYQMNSFVLQSFNKSLELLNINRQVLDLLVVKLLKNKVLYSPDIENFLKDIKKLNVDKPNTTILNSSWGIHSRRPISRSIQMIKTDSN
nr:ATP-dependent zinc metalloprotease FtsH [Picochlorum sp. 'soloecismus']